MTEQGGGGTAGAGRAEVETKDLLTPPALLTLGPTLTEEESSYNGPNHSNSFVFFLLPPVILIECR